MKKTTMNAYALLLELMMQEMEEAAAEEKRQKEKKHKEQYHCIKCGKEITDFEDTEFKQDEGLMIFTYRCSCGCYAEQIFKVEYDSTEVID